MVDDHQDHIQSKQKADPIGKQLASLNIFLPLEGLVLSVAPFLKPQAKKLADGAVLHDHQILIAAQGGLFNVGHRSDHEAHLPVFLHVGNILDRRLDELLAADALLTYGFEVAYKQRLEDGHVFVRRACSLNYQYIPHQDIREGYFLGLALPIDQKFLRGD
jgi:hypothetical protein